MDNALAFTPATVVRKLIADGAVSPVELTELFFSRIDILDSRPTWTLYKSFLKQVRQGKLDQTITRGQRCSPCPILL